MPADAGVADAPGVTAGIRGGNPAAFEVLYRAWYMRAYGLARAATRRDEAFCQDAVHDAMLRAARSIPVLASAGALDAWMTRATISACIDALRRERRRVDRERRHAATGTTPPRTSLAADIAWLQGQLADLNSTDYTLMMARVAGGRTLDQAGLAASLTGDAAHGRVRRVLQRLREAARKAGL